MATAYDLLMEPLLSWRDARRQRHKATLPGMLAHLASGELCDFSRLRAHQLEPWSMFLTQLAAIALHRAGESEPQRSEESWRTLLLGLTDGQHEPWCLVVDDLSKPAFFQPPVPEGSLDGWRAISAPDDLDILVTAKSHDVKQSRIPGVDFESWVYSAVTLQTMQGYPGRGYNAISRMKGGYGNRPRVGLSRGLSASTRFTRDVHVLLDVWPTLLERGFTDNGVALLWLPEWGGDTSLHLQELSPHFIEVCWRLRLRPTPTGLVAQYSTTSARRSLPEIETGDVGDPWTPIARDGGALTVGRKGFHYELLSKLLDGREFEPAAAQLPRPDDGDPLVLMCTALTRGQGKTEGLHERALPISGAVRRRLFEPEQRAALGRRALTFVERAKTMRQKVLFPALKELALGETTVQDSLDARIDERFFERLFETVETDDASAQLDWERTLVDLATTELQAAVDTCCVPSARRYKAIAAAESRFRFALHKQFPDAAASRQPNIEEGVQS